MVENINGFWRNNKEGRKEREGREDVKKEG